MPWLYHHYVGHDNNRDWFMLTQKETRAITRAVYHEWFPQVWLDEHQMGATGPRIFVPPYAEPVDPDIHPLIWREVNLIGANMALRLEQAGKSGVIYGYPYDAYWPGGTKNTGWWKNISGLLTEVASVRHRDARARSSRASSPAAARAWSSTAADQLPQPVAGRVVAAARHHGLRADRLRRAPRERAPTAARDFLQQRARARARRGRRRSAPTDAYRIPAAPARRGRPPRRLAALMAEHGVEVRAGGERRRLDPARPALRPLRERDARRRSATRRSSSSPGKEIVRPYDVSAWTLPLMMGVSVERATLPDGARALRRPAAARAAASTGAAVALDAGQPRERARLVNAALRGGQARIARAAPSARRARLAGGHGVPRRGGRAGGRGQGRARPVAGPPSAAVPGRGRDAARAARRPLQALGRVDGRGLDALRARAVRLRAEDARQQDRSAPASSRAAFDAIVLPDVAEGSHRDRQAAARRGRDALLRRAAARVRGRAREGGRAGAASDFVEAGGTLVAFAAATDYVIDELNAARAQRARPRASRRVPVAGLAAARRGRPATIR